MTKRELDDTIAEVGGYLLLAAAFVVLLNWLGC